MFQTQEHAGSVVALSHHSREEVVYASTATQVAETRRDGSESELAATRSRT